MAKRFAFRRFVCILISKFVISISNNKRFNNEKDIYPDISSKGE